MKIEWLIAAVIVVGSPIRAEREVFWTVFDILLLSWVTLVVVEPLCDLETFYSLMKIE